MEAYTLLMQGIIIIVGGYILIAVVKALLEERYLSTNPQPSAEAPKVDICDCKIYFNKKRGYYYAKARNAEGQLAYVKGSYAKSEEESLALCKRSSSCSA